MKTINKLVLALTAIIIVSCGGVTKQDAMSLSDKEYMITNKAITSETDFFKSCKTYNKFDIENKLADMLKAFQTSKEELQKIETKEDLKPLKEAAIKFVDSYIIHEQDYREYARIFSLPDSLYTNTEKDKQSAVAAKINKAYETSLNELRTVERSVAAKYDFKLMEEIASYKK